MAIGAGTDVAIESAGVVLAGDDPRAVLSSSTVPASYPKICQNLIWATGYNLLAVPLAAGVLAFAGVVLPPAAAAVLMSASTVVVAANAQLLRRLDLDPARANTRSLPVNGTWPRWEFVELRFIPCVRDSARPRSWTGFRGSDEQQAAGGRRRGVWSCVGVTTSNMIQGAAAAAGLGAVIVRAQPLFHAIKWAGVASWRCAVRRFGPRPRAATGRWPAIQQVPAALRH